MCRGGITMRLIEVRHITKFYQRGDETVHAVNDISFSVSAGEWIAIVGESGSGKSTLMNILGCLDTPTSGEYLLDGENTSTFNQARLAEIRNRKIGFIFQGFNLIPNLTAFENVELPLIYRGIKKEERQRLSREALNRVGLASRMDHKPAQMSGGQQQRVAVARAIAASPPIILADEPTGNLDPQSSKMIIDILKQLNADGKTVLLITHDLSIAQNAARKIQIQNGVIL